VPIVFARQPAAGDTSAIAGDLRSPEAVRAAVERVHAVCHAGALVSIWRPRPADFDEVNVDGTRHVIDACRATGVTRLIYTSSFLALPPAGRSAPLAANDYQRTKIRALELVRTAARAGMPILTMIPGVLYGPGPGTEGNLVARLLDDHLHGRLPGITGADRLWSFAWIDHVADAHVVALERGVPGREYALGGVNAPQGRLFEIARDLTGRPLPRRLPALVARAAAAAYDLRARMLGAPPLLTRAVVEIFSADWPLDSAPAVADLGYQVLPMEDGIRTLLQDLL
jgi:nucleoside-diphosphate-sugar epimerase